MISDFDDWDDESLAFLDYWQQFDAPWPGTESMEFEQWKAALAATEQQSPLDNPVKR